MSPVCRAQRDRRVLVRRVREHAHRVRGGSGVSRIAGAHRASPGSRPQHRGAPAPLGLQWPDGGRLQERLGNLILVLVSRSGATRASGLEFTFCTHSGARHRGHSPAARSCSACRRTVRRSGRARPRFTRDARHGTKRPRHRLPRRGIVGYASPRDDARQFEREPSPPDTSHAATRLQSGRLRGTRRDRSESHSVEA